MNKILKINDPIHGFVLFPSIIQKIVDSKEVQRLMRIRQLSGTNHVFPGANHTRFEHSLGVAALAQRLMRNMRDLHKVELTTEDINDCIVGSLLHDLGHGPFSHNFESVLVEQGKDHEDFTDWIIKDSELGDTLSDLSFEKDYIAHIATGKMQERAYAKGSLLSQVITSAVNVDSMDYLLRDNYHCGTKGRPVDVDRLLISIDEVDEGFLGVDISALIALEGFLLSRISSFRTIYFHKTCRAVQLMLGEGFKTLNRDLGLLKFKTPDDYTKWDDYTLWTELINHPQSKMLMNKIKRRELLKLCFETRIEMSEFNLQEQKLKNALSEASGIAVADIYIDLPSSPNVPYNHISQTRPNEIYAFKRLSNGEKKPVKLEDYSLFFNQFKGHLRLIRIYTWSAFREILQKTAIRLLKDEKIQFYLV
ncbi:HD domain-containing protein [Candidatus Lokiarchaeum ossiferum]|uniref:HD domain-containing protein n=1 Tax=Candidatus Lokiarchaeum ossiferum TaxID=2951803 RepID=UPI00352F7A3A